jgi:DNA gyrase inhibitor GyrI
MQIEVIERAPATVVFQRYQGPLGLPLAHFWRARVLPWLAEQGVVDCPRYGIAHSDTRYDCCVELPAGLTLSGGKSQTIPGGKYARITFKGTGADIGTAWEDFVAAVRAAHRIDPQRPPLEYYPRGAYVDAKRGVFACALLFPVEA